MKGRNHSDHPWPGNTWQTKPRRPRYRPKVWPDGLFGTFKVGEMAIKKRDFRCISHKKAGLTLGGARDLSGAGSLDLLGLELESPTTLSL